MSSFREGAFLASNCVIRKENHRQNAKISMGSEVFFDVEDEDLVMSRPPKSIKRKAQGGQQE
jgi:hypothetical protein